VPIAAREPTSAASSRSTAGARSRDGETLARVSAHAGGASVLIGERAALCAFDAGTAEDRAQHLYGAIALVPALRADTA
jgi:hypothetical protein